MAKRVTPKIETAAEHQDRIHIAAKERVKKANKVKKRDEKPEKPEQSNVTIKLTTKTNFIISFSLVVKSL